MTLVRGDEGVVVMSDDGSMVVMSDDVQIGMWCGANVISNNCLSYKSHLSCV